MQENINRIIDFAVELCAPYPALAQFIDHNRTMIVVIAVSVCLMLLSILSGTLIHYIHQFQENQRRKKVQKFFGVSDLSKFKVTVMGKPGTKNFNQNGTNSFELNAPYWEKANDDGSRKKALFNKVIWPDSILWLHAGPRVYILTTTDPWEMLFLVHMLRDGGLEIEPCQQELDKQERLASEKKTMDEQIEGIIVDMAGNSSAFVELCRERLTALGCTVSDAPKNNFGADLFLHWKGKPCVAKCLLTSRDTVTGAEAIRQFKQKAEDLFTDACMVITTGHVTVAAAGYARDNNVELISDDKFANLFTDNEEVPPGKEFLTWELNNDDLDEIFPDVSKK